MIWSFREKLGNWALKKARPQRKVPSPNLKSPQIVVLLNHETTEKTLIKKLESTLNQLNPSSLEFFTFKSLKAEKDSANYASGVHVIYKDDLSFNTRPANLAEKSADILIDLTERSELPLLFALNDISASIRLGVERVYNKKYLDFMIQLPEEKDCTFAAEQLVRYFNMIHTHAA